MTGAVLGLLVAAALLCGGGARRRAVPPSRNGTRPLAGRPGSGAESTLDDVADALVLLALALRGGRSPLSALDDVVARTRGRVRADLARVAAATRWGLPGTEAWQGTSPVWGPAALAWAAAERAGVSPGPLLDQAAATLRARAASETEEALGRAGVLLVLPLGLAFLPGFVATTVVPVVLRLLEVLAPRR